MTWIDRLKPDIQLTSPTGQQFAAQWTGNSRTAEKRLGVFEYPGVDGAEVQDLGIGPDRYPLTLYFDGSDHDLTAKEFWEACKEVGLWSIDHPVRGLLFLQLVSVTENMNPVESGNITTVDTEWIEPNSDIISVSITEQTAAVKGAVIVLQDQAAGQFNAVADTNAITRLKNSVNVAVTTINNTLAGAAALSADISASVSSVQRGIVSALTASTLDTLSLAGQIQTLIDLPGQAVDDVLTRYDYYNTLIENTINSNIADVAVKELVLIGCLSSLGTTIAEAEFDNREKSLVFVDNLRDVFDTITNALDESQISADIEKQYFSQSQSYNDAAQMVSIAVNLLLRRSFDLSAVKRITLGRPRVPWEIAITEGVDLDKFIESNRLKAEEILLLPAGKQVVVYL